MTIGSATGAAVKAKSQQGVGAVVQGRALKVQTVVHRLDQQVGGQTDGLSGRLEIGMR